MFLQISSMFLIWLRVGRGISLWQRLLATHPYVQDAHSAHEQLPTCLRSDIANHAHIVAVLLRPYSLELVGERSALCRLVEWIFGVVHLGQKSRNGVSLFLHAAKRSWFGDLLSLKILIFYIRWWSENRDAQICGLPEMLMFAFVEFWMW